MRNLVTCLVVCVLSSVTFADTWTVDDDGKADFTNIQAAVDAASSGDEIIVAPGVYVGGSHPDYGVVISNKDIYLHSSDGPASTILDGENTRRCMMFYEGVTSATTVEGFTFQNGYGAGSIGMGGGMYVYLSSPNITNCVFKNNYSPGQGDSGGGGAVSMRYCNSPTIFTNCVFNGNVSESVGGALSARYFSSAASLLDCTFCENEPDTSIINGPWNDLGGNDFLESCLWHDCNGNGIDDLVDIANQTSFDCDGNGVPDECQPDCDGDGWIDACDNDSDIDGDGIPDNCELDCNGNSIPDDFEIAQGIAQDCNGNGIPDDCDIVNGGQVPEGAVQWTTDEGGNGHWYLAIDHGDYLCWADAHATATKIGGYLVTLTSSEENEWVKYGVAADPDLWSDSWGPMNGGPMIGGYADENEVYRWVSDESWGYTDWHPGNPNAGRNSIIILFDLNGDSNGYGWQDISADSCEAVTSFVVEFDGMPTSNDCNENGLLDSCEIADDPSLDCNGNGTLDSCEEFDDCNYNEIPDNCDLTDGTSNDVNMNGVPDECESDCNENGIPDDWEIKNALVLDCNENMLPDECDIADGTSTDVNSNDVPDECEDDCNGNGIPDDWDIKTGAAIDCNGNGIPDSCDVAAGCDADCNVNGVPDSCDLASGTSEDINANNLPDECECIADISGDGVVDIDDILALIGYWDSPGPLGDFNADGIVSIHDLLILVSGWGECTNVPCSPPMAGAVQWTIEEGGNGHWYGLAQATGGDVCFNEIRLLALDLGGDLVIIQSDAENSFVTDLLIVSGNIDYWIGLIQNLSSPDYSEPSGGWEWIDGTPLAYSHWHSSEPNDPSNTENACGIYSGGWFDMGYCRDIGTPQYAVIEWSD
jgi:hypothetical protein